MSLEVISIEEVQVTVAEGRKEGLKGNVHVAVKGRWFSCVLRVC